MCGIFGYIGGKEAVKIAIEGLKRLEYRGYDSAGIAGVKNGQIYSVKEVGKVVALEKEVEREQLSLDVAISHTRWATHGSPSQVNAHPHYDMNHSLALVHNGIIENYSSLRDEMLSRGIRFVSETDTEVVAHLIAHFYRGNLVDAVQETMKLLKGAFAIAVVHKEHPDMIVTISRDAPMAIGMGTNQTFVSSDSNAFAAYTKNVVYLENEEIAIVKKDKVEFFNAKKEAIKKEVLTLSIDAQEMSKGKYEHYTLKEINEQPVTIRNAFSSRCLDEYGTAHFEGIMKYAQQLHSVERILILACGTSLHAGYVAAYTIEDKSGIPVQVEISSEFRYKNPVVGRNVLVIAISQSGETADTLAAVRELKSKGATIFALCNVQGATLVREADYTLFLYAGPEIGVCSTKAFTSQLVVLNLFALLLARMRHMSKEDGQAFLHALKQIPDQVKQVLEGSPHIEYLAKKYAHYENFFFLGRSQMYPTALEGALKLKEISYINANGYPAGEMKHGPIALINEQCPTIALCANHRTYEKMLSNLMEVKARKGPVIAIIEEGDAGVDKIADDIIRIPCTIDELSPITSTVVTQLFAYYVALERGTDIDQPKNLAKSVTVE